MLYQYNYSNYPSYIFFLLYRAEQLYNLKLTNLRKMTIKKNDNFFKNIQRIDFLILRLCENNYNKLDNELLVKFSLG